MMRKQVAEFGKEEIMLLLEEKHGIKFKEETFSLWHSGAKGELLEVK